MSGLEGRVVVIAVGDATAREAALACAADGAAVVLVAVGDAETRAGEIAREVAGDGGRVSVFAGSLATAGDRGALAEMLAELY